MVVATRRTVVSVLVMSTLAMLASWTPRADAATYRRGRAGGKTLVGSGRLRTETRKVRDIHALTLVAPTRVRITQGNKESLTIEAEDNLLSLITTESRHGELTIDFGGDSVGTIRTTKPITVDLMVKDLSKISILGASDVESPGLRTKTFSLSVLGSGAAKLDLQADETRIDIPGSGNVDLKLQTGELHLSIPGSGDCRLAGTADREWIDVSGSGECTAAGLVSDEAHVTVTGSGEVKVRANKTLDATITGSGQVRYAGDAKVTSNVTGSGSVRRLSSGATG